MASSKHCILKHHCTKLQHILLLCQHFNKLNETSPFFRSLCRDLQPNCSGNTCHISCTSRGQSVSVLPGPALWRPLEGILDVDKFNRCEVKGCWGKCEAPFNQRDALSQWIPTNIEFPECQPIRRRFLWVHSFLGSIWHGTGTFYVCEHHCRYVESHILAKCMTVWIGMYVSVCALLN